MRWEDVKYDREKAREILNNYSVACGVGAHKENEKARNYIAGFLLQLEDELENAEDM
jgi:hypothetical protein